MVCIGLFLVYIACIVEYCMYLHFIRASYGTYLYVFVCNVQMDVLYILIGLYLYVFMCTDLLLCIQCIGMSDM